MSHQSIFISYFSISSLFLIFLFQYNINHLLSLLMSRKLFKNYSELPKLRLQNLFVLSSLHQRKINPTRK